MSNDEAVELTREFVRVMKLRPEQAVKCINEMLRGERFCLALHWKKEPETPQEASPFFVGNEV